MLPASLMNFDWISGDDLWLIVGIGAAFAILAFLLGSRLLARRPAIEGPHPDSADTPDPFSAGSAGERRQAFRRKGSSIGVQISELNQTQEALPGCVLDRSITGVGLWSEKKFTVGDRIKVRPDSSPPMTPWVEVEVRSCKELEGGWQLGCIFLATPPYSVLLLFG